MIKVQHILCTLLVLALSSHDCVYATLNRPNVAAQPSHTNSTGAVIVENDQSDQDHLIAPDHYSHVEDIVDSIQSSTQVRKPIVDASSSNTQSLLSYDFDADQTTLGSEDNYFSDTSICKSTSSSTGRSSSLIQSVRGIFGKKKKQHLYSALEENEEPSPVMIHFKQLKSIYVTWDVYKACKFNHQILPNLEDLNVKIQKKSWSSIEFSFKSETEIFDMFFNYPKLRQVDIYDKRGTTLLMESVERYWYDVFGLAAAYSKNIDAKNDYGATALTFALQQKFEHAANILIDMGASVNTVTNNGLSMFTLAATGCSEDLVYKMARVPGAQIDYADGKGMTALMYAAQYGDIPGCIGLIRGGANVNLKDNSGLTASGIAKLTLHFMTAMTINDYAKQMNSQQNH